MMLSAILFDKQMLPPYTYQQLKQHCRQLFNEPSLKDGKKLWYQSMLLTMQNILYMICYVATFDLSMRFQLYIKPYLHMHSLLTHLKKFSIQTKIPFMTSSVVGSRQNLSVLVFNLLQKCWTLCKHWVLTLVSATVLTRWNKKEFNTWL